jgi:tripartite-type tricarboxylate transporter receptor subunit TctC
MQRALHKTLNDPAVQTHLNELGGDLTHGSSDDMRKLVHDEIPMFAQIIKSAGIKVD